MDDTLGRNPLADPVLVTSVNTVLLLQGQDMTIPPAESQPAVFST
jgi:hypothetical protein